MKNNENNLNLAVVPQDFLDKMEVEIIEMKAILKAKNEDEINSQWIPSVKIPKILGISLKSWQEYRNRRLLPFSQIGSKIYVKRADLEKFMNDHYIDKIR